MAKYCVLTFGDFGDKANLKTKESSWFIDAIKQANSENSVDVFCRLFSGKKKSDIKPMLPFGVLTLGFFHYLRKLFRRVNSTMILYNLIDSRAKKKVKDYDALFCVSQHFVKSMKEMRSLGRPTMMSFTGVPNVSRPGEPVLDPYLEREHKKGLDRILNCCQYADHMFVLSTLNKELLVENGIPAERIIVTNLGVDSERFVPVKKKDDVFRIVCVGHYGLYKGFQNVLKAWDELKLKNAELIFVGNPDPDMKPIVAEFEQKYKNFKAVGAADPLPYYQDCSLLVHPSIMDGWGKVVTEAMACGKAVLVSDATGAKDAVVSNKNGFVFARHDVDELTSKIKFFYDNQKKCDSMGKASRKIIVDRFRADAFIETVSKELKKIERKN